MRASNIAVSENTLFKIDELFFSIISDPHFKVHSYPYIQFIIIMTYGGIIGDRPRLIPLFIPLFYTNPSKLALAYLRDDYCAFIQLQVFIHHFFAIQLDAALLNGADGFRGAFNQTCHF